MSNVEQSLSRHSHATSPEPLNSNAVDSSQEVRLNTPAVDSTPQLNLTTMANSQETSSSVPTGIEDDVLAKINAFLERSEPTRPNLSRRGPSSQMEAWSARLATPSSDQTGSTTLASHQEKDTPSIAGEKALEFDPDEFRLPPSEEGFVDFDEEFSEKDALLPQDINSTSPDQEQYDYNVTDPNAPRIIARYIYPSERMPPALPLRKHVPPPTLFSLLAMFCGYLLSFIFADEPEIIEYSPQEIKRRAGDISVEVQVVEFPAEPEKVVGVMALIHVGDGEYRQAYPITAKPKRVRELMKDEVGRTAEDAYGKEIKGALKALQKMAN